MCKVLYIKSAVDIKEGIDPCAVSDDFVKAYGMTHPKDEVTVLDLGREQLDPISNDDLLKAVCNRKKNDRKDPLLKYAYQFAEADKYIFAEPLCDAGIAAVLNYIDHVGIMDIAYRHASYGTVGLLKGKKAVNIVSAPHASAFPFKKMGEEYLKNIFSFFGVTDFTTIVAEGENKRNVHAQAKAF